MRIAILADIHGNFPALQAVLNDIHGQQVDEIILAGDMINVAPFPREVLDTAYHHKWRMIRGNHEGYMLDCADPTCANYPPPDLWRSMYWTYNQLISEDIELFRQLPEEIVVDNLVIMHGIPGKLNISPVPATPLAILDKWYGQVEQDYIVTAHTHIPFITQWNNKTLVNPGSVGVSFDGITSASYMIATQESRDWRFEHRRVAYDVNLVEHAAETRGYLATDVFAKVSIRQIRDARPMMYSLLQQIDSLQKDQGLSLGEAITSADITQVQPSYDYIFPHRAIDFEGIKKLSK